MVTLKAAIDPVTTIKGGRIRKTDLQIDEDEYAALAAYMRPLVNDFINRRILGDPDMAEQLSEGEWFVFTKIRTRESKAGQTVTLEKKLIVQNSV